MVRPAGLLGLNDSDAPHQLRRGTRGQADTIRPASRGVAQLGSAPALGAGGRGFESPLPDGGDGLIGPPLTHSRGQFATYVDLGTREQAAPPAAAAAACRGSSLLRPWELTSLDYRELSGFDLKLCGSQARASTSNCVLRKTEEVLLDHFAHTVEPILVLFNWNLLVDERQIEPPTSRIVLPEEVGTEGGSHPITGAR